MPKQTKIVIELDIEQFKLLVRGGTLNFGSEEAPDKDPVFEIMVSKSVPLLSTLQETIYQMASASTKK